MVFRSLGSISFLTLAALLSACDNGGTTSFTSSPSATVSDARGKAVTFTTAAGSIESLSLVAQPAAAPAGYAYPNGFFSFRITGLTPGATVPVTVNLPAGSGVTGFLKCTSAGCAQFRGATVQGDTLTLMLTDGGDGDADGVADGVITDPGGPDFPIAIGKLSPGSVDFGNQLVGGQQVTQTVTFKNVGNAPLKVLSSQPANAQSQITFSGVTAVTLQPNQSLDITVSLTPTTTGMVSNTLTIATDAGEVDLPATANVVAPVQATPASLDFGQQQLGSSTTLSVTLKNVTQDATVSAQLTFVSPVGAGFGLAPGGSLPPLAPGQSGTVGVVFNPTQVGAAQATLAVLFNVTRNGQTTQYTAKVNLTGTGVSGSSSGSSGGSSSSGSSGTSSGGSGSSSSGGSASSSGSGSSSGGGSSGSGSSTSSGGGSSSSSSSGSSSSSSGSSTSSSSSGSAGSSSSGSGSGSSSSSGSGSSSGGASSSSSSGATTGLGLFTGQQIASGSSSGGGSAVPDQGVNVITFPIPGNSACNQGSSCTVSPAVKMADPLVTPQDFMNPFGDSFGAILPDPRTGEVVAAKQGGLFLLQPPNFSNNAVSSESQFNQPCSSYPLRIDLNNAPASLFFYQLPGTNNSCLPSNSTFRYTPLNAGATTPPPTAPAMPPFARFEAFYDSSGKATALDGVVVNPSTQHNDLVQYNTSLGNPTTLASNVNFLTPFGQNSTSKIYADSRNIFRLAANGSFTTVFNFPSGFFGLGTDEVFNDTSNFFFFLRNSSSGLLQVWKMPMDASTTAAPIANLPGDNTIFYSIVGVTDTKLEIYGTTRQLGSSSNLYSVSKSPVSPPESALLLQNIPSTFTPQFITTQGNKIYYNFFSNDGKSVLAYTSVDDGSAAPVIVSSARWLYYVVDNRTPAGLYDDRVVTDLLQVHGITNFFNTGDAGATVTVFHLADGTSHDLVNLGSYYAAGTSVDLSFPDSGQPQGTCIVRLPNGSGGFQNDACAFDVTATTAAQAYVQLTNTPKVDEQLIPYLRSPILFDNRAKRLGNFN